MGNIILIVELYSLIYRLYNNCWFVNSNYYV